MRHDHFTIKQVHLIDHSHTSKTFNANKRCELLPAQKLDKNERGSKHAPLLTYLTVDKLVDPLSGT